MPFIAHDSWAAVDTKTTVVVEVMGRLNLTVTESGVVYHLSCELADDPNGISLYVDDVHRVDGDTRRRIDADASHRIAKLAYAGLKALGMTIVIFPPAERPGFE